MRKRLQLIFMLITLGYFGWSQAIFDDGGADNNWSTVANWTTDALPTTAQYGQLNSDATLDIDTEVAQLRSGFRTLNAGMGSLTINGDFNGIAILQVAAGQTFTINAPIIINSDETFENIQINGSNGTITFAENSILTLTSQARLTVSNTGTHNMNGTINGPSDMHIQNNTTFGSTSENKDYTGQFVFSGGASTAVVNTANPNSFVSASARVQVNNSGSTLTVNEANVYQGAMNVGGTNDFTWNLYAKQNSMDILGVGDGIITIDVGADVDSLFFADVSAEPWGSGTVNITGFKDKVIRFGTSSSGLTPTQLAQISTDAPGTLVIDADGFLIAPEDLTISTTTTSTADMVVNNLTVNAGTILTIDAGHTLTVNNDISNNGSIIVNSGGSLITFDGNTIGEVTIKRNTRYADGKYSFVGTPVVANASITGSDLGSTVYTYDETVAYGSNNGLDRWMDASSTPLTPGVGYAQAFQQEISFTGVPNDGTITVSGLTHTAPDAMHDEHGWQLLSNPYPAAIAVDKFLANATNAGSLNGSVYLWDDHGSETGRGDNGDYLTVNSLGAVGGPNGGSFNGYIGAMQGFFVKVASPTTGVSVEFTESMRVLGGNEDANFFRQIKEEPITVKLSIQTTDGLFNELLVGLTADATLGVDKKFDASKLVANQDLQFYSLMSGDKFAIQGLPVTSGVSTELGFDLGNSSDLTLKVQELNGLESEMTFFLHDTQTGNFYDLSEVSTVNFSAKAGSDQNRFKLIYSANGVLSTDLEIDQPVYRFTNNILNVRFGKHTAVEGYAVYDMSGKVLHQLELKGKVQNEVNIPVDNKGLTIIRVITDMGMFTRKFIF